MLSEKVKLQMAAVAAKIPSTGINGTEFPALWLNQHGRKLDYRAYGVNWLKQFLELAPDIFRLKMTAKPPAMFVFAVGTDLGVSSAQHVLPGNLAKKVKHPEKVMLAAVAAKIPPTGIKLDKFPALWLSVHRQKLDYQVYGVKWLKQFLQLAKEFFRLEVKSNGADPLAMFVYAVNPSQSHNGASLPAAAPPVVHAVSPVHAYKVSMDPDIESALQVLPDDVAYKVKQEMTRRAPAMLVDIILDIGRPISARFLDRSSGRKTTTAVSEADVVDEIMLDEIAAVKLTAFSKDNRASIRDSVTLHRVSRLLDPVSEQVLGLTIRIGRVVPYAIDEIRELVLDNATSMLIIGKAGAGKTTVLREISRLLSVEGESQVMIVDAACELAGAGAVPHPSIGMARCLRVADRSRKHDGMIEAVQNHTPDVLVVDELANVAESRAAADLTLRGVRLFASVHGESLQDILRNRSLNAVLGGVETVTVSDHVAGGRTKLRRERAEEPAFRVAVVLTEKGLQVVKDVKREVDKLLLATREQRP